MGDISLHQEVLAQIQSQNSTSEESVKAKRAFSRSVMIYIVAAAVLPLLALFVLLYPNRELE